MARKALKPAAPIKKPRPLLKTVGVAGALLMVGSAQEPHKFVYGPLNPWAQQERTDAAAANLVAAQNYKAGLEAQLHDITQREPAARALAADLNETRTAAMAVLNGLAKTAKCEGVLEAGELQEDVSKQLGLAEGTYACANIDGVTRQMYGFDERVYTSDRMARQQLAAVPLAHTPAQLRNKTVRSNSSYGMRPDQVILKEEKRKVLRLHGGQDWIGALGVKVIVTGNGKIVGLQKDKTSTQFCGSNYGNCILVDHGDGIYTRYAHLASFTKGLKVGDYVTQGQPLGVMGGTGRVTGPHLHYEVLKGKYNNNRNSLRAIDPAKAEVTLKLKLPTEVHDEFDAAMEYIQGKVEGVVAAAKVDFDARDAQAMIASNEAAVLRGKLESLPIDIKNAAYKVEDAVQGIREAAWVNARVTDINNAALQAGANVAELADQWTKSHPAQLFTLVMSLSFGTHVFESLFLWPRSRSRRKKSAQPQVQQPQAPATPKASQRRSKPEKKQKQKPAKQNHREQQLAAQALMGTTPKRAPLLPQAPTSKRPVKKQPPQKRL